MFCFPSKAFNCEESCSNWALFLTRESDAVPVKARSSMLGPEVLS